jgi:hypothetical protein
LETFDEIAATFGSREHVSTVGEKISRQSKTRGSSYVMIEEAIPSSSDRALPAAPFGLLPSPGIGDPEARFRVASRPPAAVASCGQLELEFRDLSYTICRQSFLAPSVEAR